MAHESRLGGPIAFNAGLRRSRGQFIARMDADDVATQTRFEQQLRYMEVHKDIDILGGQALKIDEFGTVVGHSHVPISPLAIRHASRYGAPFVHPTLMFRRHVWERLGGYREFSPGADYDMLIRALDLGMVVANLPNVLLKYRVRSDSVSHISRQRTVAHSFAIKKMRTLRRTGRIAKEQYILARLRRSTMHQDAWFATLDKYVYRLTNSRNRRALERPSDLRIHITNLLIAGLSALHPQMIRALWAAFRLKMVLVRYEGLRTFHSLYRMHYRASDQDRGEIPD